MAFDNRSVFLNVPFDRSYERMFLWQIAALVALSHTPRSALELAEDGKGRLNRLLDLISGCSVSIHDLSRVGTPVRFNMPFELGLACSAAHSSRHKFMLFEKLPRRLQQTLSDMNGRDPMIHRGSPRQALFEIFGAFSVTGQVVDPDIACEVAAKLEKLVVAEKRKRRQQTIFKPIMFKFAVEAALQLSADAKLILE